MDDSEYINLEKEPAIYSEARQIMNSSVKMHEWWSC